MEVSSNRDISIYKGDIYTSHESISRKSAKLHTRKRSPLSISDYESAAATDDGDISDRLRLSITAAIYLLYFCMGLNSASVGTTLVHMSYIYQTNIQMMSFAIVFVNLGYTLGAVLSGFLFDIFSEVVQFTVGVPFMAILVAMTPWMPSIYTFYAAVACSNAVQGYLFPGCLSFCLTLWSKHQYKQSVFQAMHTMRCIGSFALPFIAVSFLVELPDHQEENSIFQVQNSSCLNVTDSIDENIDMGNTIVTSGIINQSNGQYDNTVPSDIKKITYVFLIISICMILTFIYFLILTCILRPPLFRSKLSQKKLVLPSDENNSEFCKTLKYKISIRLLFVLTLMFSLVYFLYDYVVGSMLYTFAFTGLHFSVQKASVITSLFYGAQCIGRISSIAISAVLSSTKILCVNISFTLVGYVIMMFVPMNVNFMWVATAVTGLFVSSTMPCIQLWLSDYITVTGSVSSAILVTSAVSSMGGITLAGHLYQNYGHMSIMILAITTAAINAVIFMVMVAISQLQARWRRIETGH